MLLSEITALRGPAGYEHEVREALRNEAISLIEGVPGARVYSDTMGNLYAYRPGTDKTTGMLPAASPTKCCKSSSLSREADALQKDLHNKKHVMLCAHMDEVGFIIRFATEEGLLRFSCVGGVDPRVIASRRVLVGDKRIPGVIGFKAVHLMTDEEYERAPGYDMLSIDIGASSKEEAEKLCPPGTYATFDSRYVEFGDGFAKAKALDDRVGCLVLLDALKNSDYAGDLTCVFTVQEECGLRGAKIAANKVKPDLALILEGTTSNDMGDVPEHLQVTVCGAGAVISVMDRSAIMNHALRELAMETAKKRGIPAQYKKAVAGGTDAGPVHIAQGGIPCLVMAVPCRYIHSPASVCKLSDIEALKALTLALLEEV